MSKTTPTPTIETVNILYAQVSAEGFGVAEFINAIPVKFSELSASVKDFAGATLRSGFSSTSRTNVYHLTRLLERSNYITLSDVEVFVPPGLSVTLYDYVQVLKEHSGVLDGILDKVLLPGIRWANSYLRDPSRLVSVRDFYAESGMEKIDIKKAKEDIARCMSGNQSSDRQIFGKVAKSFKDYSTAVGILNELVIETESVSNKNVLEKVDVFANVIDNLSDKVQIGDQRFKFSPAIMTQFADTIHHVAETVELYAALVTYIRTAAESVKATEERLQNILKD